MESGIKAQLSTRHKNKHIKLQEKSQENWLMWQLTLFPVDNLQENSIIIKDNV